MCGIGKGNGLLEVIPLLGVHYIWDIYKWKVHCKNYETVPFLLQRMVTDFVKSLDILPEECVAVAFAVAEFPLLLEETDLIFHVFAGQVVLWEHDVHLAVLPL